MSVMNEARPGGPLAALLCGGRRYGGNRCDFGQCDEEGRKFLREPIELRLRCPGRKTVGGRMDMANMVVR